MEFSLKDTTKNMPILKTLGIMSHQSNSIWNYLINIDVVNFHVQRSPKFTSRVYREQFREIILVKITQNQKIESGEDPHFMFCITDHYFAPDP